MIGRQDGGAIDSCFSEANIAVGGSAGGGLVGWLNSNSVISNSHATQGTITSTYTRGGVSLGGLVGQMNGGSVYDSYATASILETLDTSNGIGGLIGYLSGSPFEIEDSFATGGRFGRI